MVKPVNLALILPIQMELPIKPLTVTQPVYGVKSVKPSGEIANSTGQYIRVQKQGQGFITLAEVQVFGCPAVSSCTVGASCDDGDSNTVDDKYINSDCECVGTTNPDTCNSIDVSVSNGNTIQVNNLYNENQIIKVFTDNWNQLDVCNSYNGGNCEPSYSYTVSSAGTYNVQILISGQEGEECNITETVQVGNGNKLTPLNDNQRLLIFPNPIENNAPTLVFDSPEDEQIDIQIYNINSQLVHSQQTSTVSGINEITLDIQATRLASGVYFVKVISEKYTYGATRFVKP